MIFNDTKINFYRTNFQKLFFFFSKFYIYSQIINLNRFLLIIEEFLKRSKISHHQSYQNQSYQNTFRRSFQSASVILPSLFCWESSKKEVGWKRRKGRAKSRRSNRVHRNALRRFRHRLDINLEWINRRIRPRCFSARDGRWHKFQLRRWSRRKGRRRERERKGKRKREREREMERRSENGRGRGWLRECTKLFLSRGNRGVLCALRHRQAALCSVHAMRIDWPGPYESGYTTSGRRFRLLSSLHPSPTSLFRLALRVFYRIVGWRGKFAEEFGGGILVPAVKRCPL